VADFGAFVELEPGIEALAHVSTFAPTARAADWKKSVPVGTTATFEILSVDPAQKRIGVALVEEGSSRAAAADQHDETESSDGATRTDTISPPSLGTLGDSLRDILKGR
jgi:small subunit ribosomal protein S1